MTKKPRKSVAPRGGSGLVRPKPQQVEVIIKVVHEYKQPEHDQQYKQNHPDEYEWDSFWNDWVPLQKGHRPASR